MSITRRIYVSLPADPWLTPNINELKWGIVEEIEKLGYTPEIFTNPKGKRFPCLRQIMESSRRG